MLVAHRYRRSPTPLCRRTALEIFIKGNFWGERDAFSDFQFEPKQAARWRQRGRATQLISTMFRSSASLMAEDVTVKCVSYIIDGVWFCSSGSGRVGGGIGGGCADHFESR
jgi:hypothetical protein